MYSPLVLQCHLLAVSLRASDELGMSRAFRKLDTVRLRSLVKHVSSQVCFLLADGWFMF